MTSRIVPVILCGGSGTRLWPLSRVGFPKQFLSLAGDETLFQQAVLRIAGLKSVEIEVCAPLIVTNEVHRFIAAEQLRESGIEPGAFLLEPVGRNTAPALSLAAMAALEQGHDPVLVVTPSDQMVVNQPAFIAAMQTAVRVAETGALVVLGISPDRPETGYGYIKAVAEDTAALPDQIFAVEGFVEKPDADTAQSYLDAGGYYWNAGMFVLKASVWMASLERFRPDIGVAVHVAWAQRSIDKMFIRPGKVEFAAIPAESIDFAVMEQCPASEFSVKMVPLAAGWSDLGAWDAVWKILTKDESGNVYFGDVLATDSRNTLVYATSRLVTLVGVEDLIVVETADAVLVADRSSSQSVKTIVNQLNSVDREEHTLHRKVHRPWGWYDSIDEGERFKVKRIQVNPGASLSLQKHHHRAEHWVVVKGTAEIVCGDKTILLTENQSTYIPLGETHRLTNPSELPLEIIEVQSGSYLGEDDIVRFEDSYGR
jgi:mannose-1-phosphate guanylyltransferase / mannose-6-phosphate isomerase